MGKPLTFFYSVHMPTRRQRPTRIQFFFKITTFDIAFYQSNLSTIDILYTVKRTGKPLTLFYSVYMPTRRQSPARILLHLCHPKLASRVVTRGAKMMIFLQCTCLPADRVRRGSCCNPASQSWPPGWSPGGRR